MDLGVNNEVFCLGLIVHAQSQGLVVHWLQRNYAKFVRLFATRLITGVLQIANYARNYAIAQSHSFRDPLVAIVIGGNTFYTVCLPNFFITSVLNKKLGYCLETARRESWTEMTLKCPSRLSKVAPIEASV